MSSESQDASNSDTPNANQDIPLCVDLDGTLVLTDTTFETLMLAIKRNPFIILMLPYWWIAKGRPYLKRKIHDLAQIDATSLPYNQSVIDYIKEQRAHRSKIIMVTGTYRPIAESVQAHTQLFDDVMATDEQINLVGRAKGDHLVECFGEKGFDYIGNDKNDEHVWRRTANPLVANADPKWLEKLKTEFNFLKIFERAPITTKDYLKAIRIHQWSKNTLLFIPLVAAHQIFNAPALLSVLLAFIVFSLVASATYLLNDLLDLDADRQHRTKRLRPFASGKISVLIGAKLVIGLMVVSAVLTLCLPTDFGLALFAYLVTTLSYSLALKRFAALDIVLLAALYTLRVIAGSYAAGVALSFWLLAFSMFIFLSLATIKRISEIIGLEEAPFDEASNDMDGATDPMCTQANKQTGKQHLLGRGYSISDKPILMSLGSASSYVAIAILALYINSNEVVTLYTMPKYLWFICPAMLFWVTRVWILTSRGAMNEDPVIFALTDRWSWLIILYSGVILMLAT